MQIDEFARGCEHLEDRAHLAARLARGDRLRIKFGVDPTAPDLHLGHTVPMRALRRWQRAGHVAVIVIGDWTARIGDPSGRSQTRPPLSAEQVAANAQTYLAQLFSVLDRSGTEVRYQSEWFDPMGLADVLRLAGSRTIQQMLQRNDFAERMSAGRAVSTHELLYPLLQGYDSVAVDADVEIGGTDQLFNLLVARDVQRHYSRAEPQDVATFPLLQGLDGVRKMSKSYGNAIGVSEPPTAQYGKLMSIGDEHIVRWMTLVSDLTPERIDAVANELASDGINPRDAKAELAHAVVRQLHGEAAADAARDVFSRVTREADVPDELAEVRLAPGERSGLQLSREVADGARLGFSGGELRRLLRDGAVRLRRGGGEWETLAAERTVVPVDEDVLRVGRRGFVRLRVGAQ